ncbi:hypothetical protein D9M68_608580 [compost metagenome]
MEHGVGALLRAAQVQPQVHQPVERRALAEPLALHAGQVVVAVEFAGGHLVDVAVGVAGAQQRLLVRTQFGIGMGGGAGVVRPVVHGRRAAVRQLGATQHHAVVEIVGRVQGRGRVLGGVVREAAVARGEAAADGAPHVIVRIDEARHDDHVGRIDDLRASRCAQAAPDLLDHAVADPYVGARQHALGAVDRDDRAVADQVIAASKAGRRGRTRCAGRHRRRADERRRTGGGDHQGADKTGEVSLGCFHGSTE